MMLCLKAEAAIANDEEDDGQLHHQLKQCDDLYNNPPSPSSLFLPTMNTIGNTIHRYIVSSSKKMRANNGVGGFKSPFSDASSSSSSSSASIPVNNGSDSGILFLGKMEDANNANDGDHGNYRRGNLSDHRSRLEQDDAKANDEQNGNERTRIVSDNRSRLEQDIKLLQAQLKEETDLHLMLASAIANSTKPFSDPLIQLPDKVQKLLTDIAVLETTVSKLEQEAITFRFQLTWERNERCLTEYHLRQSPSCSSSPLTNSHVTPKELVATPSTKNREGTTLDDLILQADVREWKNKDSYLENLRQQPNQLSEEMVRCMRNIFLCLTDSSKFSSSGCMAAPASPQGHLSHSSIASVSDSSSKTASKQSSSLEHGVLTREDFFDPYQVQGKLNWTKYLGNYSNAAEVSWMSVGEKQLEYAAGALKRFRLLVEQLAKVNPACLNTNERLAFWINLYNALIMHAYLAYGVPRSDIKFFSLTQKAAYTVGGHSLSAADIEYIILKMRPPSHRPQIALVLALHKFKLPEEQRKYSIENSEPLVAFALSCGMHSSPAVRVFKPKNVMEDLQASLKDYIQASVGINSKGKLLVPKLLHCYTRGLVEDSMLPDWICRFLSPEQAAMVRGCSSHHKNRLLSPRSFTVQHFDSTFRYLFLPENEISPSYP